ncbi:MAG: YidC/Oxa1 family insertase periplasmic-domain containing protein [Planctomycetales bacterium]
MSKDRFLLFIILSAAIFIGWEAFIAPKIRPKLPPKKEVAAAKPGEPATPVKPGEQPAAKTDPAQKPAAADDKKQTDAKPEIAVKPDDKQEKAGLKVPEHPAKIIKLGSLDFKNSRYRMQVTIDSLGAVLNQIELNDRQYRDSEPPYGPLKLLGNSQTPLRSLECDIPVIDEQLAKLSQVLSTKSLHWEVVPGSQSESNVALRLKSPDGQWEVTKTFHLQEIPEKNPKDQGPAYDLQFEIQVKNLSDKTAKAGYVLTGPVGLPLENHEYTREFRIISVGFDQGDGKVIAKSTAAREIISSAKSEKPEVWEEPIRYVGVNVQYFAALLLPQEDQPQSSVSEIDPPHSCRRKRRETREK